MEITLRFRRKPTAKEEKMRQREHEEVERRLNRIEAEVRVLMKRAGIKPEPPVRAVNE